METIRIDALRKMTENNWLRFSDMERVAIYAILGNMVNVDGSPAQEELFYLAKVRECFKLTDTENMMARSTNADTLFSIITNMTKEKKTAVLMLLNEIIVADKPATDKEHWFLGAVSVRCQLL